jgi:hypothetical protein
MSAMTRMNKKPMPKLSWAKPAGKSSIRVMWKAGPRAGKSETIDLSPLINSFKFYKPLRSGARLFKTIEIIDDGEAIAWDDGMIDMAATSVERLAEEAMTSSDFRKFIKTHGLTQESAAALLGRSRRQIANYLAGTKIPRLVALACFGLQARESFA